MTVKAEQLDKLVAVPCTVFDRYGITGLELLLVLFVSMVTILIVCVSLYVRRIRRNGGFESLGEISLDGAGTDGIGSDTIVSRVVKSGTFALARVKTFFDKVVFERRTLGRIPGRRNYVKVPDGEEEATLFGNHNEEFQDDSSLNEHTFHDEAVGLEHIGSRDPDVLNERLFDIESDNDVPEVAREEQY